MISEHDGDVLIENQDARRYVAEKHHRRSIRLRGYDYSSAGAYFVTMCTKDRKCDLGIMKNATVELSANGNVVHDVWMEIDEKFSDVELDEFAIMPNHLHGIVVIRDGPSIRNRRRGLINQTPTTPTFQPINHQWILMKNPHQTLGKIVRFFKAKSSKLIRDFGDRNFTWQRNYYERVIRNHEELKRIRQYIINNPLQWELDNENPRNREMNL